MTPAIDSLLERLKAQGGELVPTGPDSLKVTAPAPLPDEFMAELRQHKAELLSALGMRRPYRYALRGGEGGGVFLSTAPDVEAARAELVRVYGHRLLVVTAAGLFKGHLSAVGSEPRVRKERDPVFQPEKGTPP